MGRCEHKFCIYQEKGECIATEVSHNEIGMCTECITVNVSDEMLTQEKQRLLNLYEQDDLGRPWNIDNYKNHKK